MGSKQRDDTLPGNMKPLMFNKEFVDMVISMYGNIPGMNVNKGSTLYKSTIESLRTMDLQDAINKGKWYNLPYGVTQGLIERMLYLRYTNAAFYLEPLDRFFVLPYVGKGIDVVGQYVNLTPLPFNGAAEGGKDENGKVDYEERPLIQGLTLKVQNDFVPANKLFGPNGIDIFTNSAVILRDYTQRISNKPIARSTLIEPLIQMEAEILCFLRTALLNGTGVDGIRISSIDEAPSVAMASNNLTQAAINGERWVPLVGTINTEELSHQTGLSIEDYLVALQAIDNLRLSMHGISNGGLFQKKAHMLQDEQNQLASGMASLVEQDLTRNRQEWCTICNSIWGWGVWYEPSEAALEGDMNMDGMVMDDYGDTTGGKENGTGLS